MLIVNGMKSDPNAQMAHAGMMEALGPAVASGDIVLVEDFWPQSPRSEEAYALVERLIDSGVRIDGIIASNDMLAESAIRALSVKRLAGKVVVAGADADLAACQRIAEGTQYMTVYKPIEEIASKAAELAIFMAGSERFTVHKAVWDGSNRVPFYVIDPVFVSKENLGATVIKDGFHLAQDVYRNVVGERRR
jgi:D-xylose transport system substrate-binding protein